MLAEEFDAAPGRRCRRDCRGESCRRWSRCRPPGSSQLVKTPFVREGTAGNVCPVSIRVCCRRTLTPPRLPTNLNMPEQHGFPSACRGRPGRARAHTFASLPNVSIWKFSRNEPRTCCRCGWVEPKRRLRGAFAEARDTETFLVFDEADSLLADRNSARRNWEVSQVNEMLTWMESHPLPFACTTNFGKHLDPATLRRFVFKIALDYLGSRTGCNLPSGVTLICRRRRL